LSTFLYDATANGEVLSGQRQWLTETRRAERAGRRRPPALERRGEVRGRRWRTVCGDSGSRGRNSYFLLGLRGADLEKRRCVAYNPEKGISLVWKRLHWQPLRCFATSIRWAFIITSPCGISQSQILQLWSNTSENYLLVSSPEQVLKINTCFIEHDKNGSTPCLLVRNNEGRLLRGLRAAKAHTKTYFKVTTKIWKKNTACIYLYVCSSSFATSDIFIQNFGITTYIKKLVDMLYKGSHESKYVSPCKYQMCLLFLDGGVLEFQEGIQVHG
jgi:hypothetical protein